MYLAASVLVREEDKAYDEANNRTIEAPFNYIVIRVNYAMGKIPTN